MIRYFIWLAFQQKLIINVKRVKRRLSHDCSCGFCCHEYEYVLHVLRDCPAVRDIWKHIIPKDKEMSIGNAFLDSLCSVFGKIVTFSHSKVFHGVQAKLLKSLTVGPNSMLHVVKRTNGVVKVDRGFVVVGGVLRDRSERWIIDFNRFLGFCSITEAELWGIKDGLELLLERNFDSVLIQTNSMEVINAIQEQASSGSELALVRRMHQLLSRIEYWTTRHIPRKDNKEADGITKLLQEMREDYKYSRLPLWEVSFMLM
ncbi:hypothetical protein Gotur_005497 [Gossypium turneri]